MKGEEIKKLKKLNSNISIDLLQHSEKGVHRFSAHELGYRKEPHAVDALILLLQENKTVLSAAQYVAWALAEIGATWAGWVGFSWNWALSFDILRR